MRHSGAYDLSAPRTASSTGRSSAGTSTRWLTVCARCAARARRTTSDAAPAGDNPCVMRCEFDLGAEYDTGVGGNPYVMHYDFDRVTMCAARDFFLCRSRWRWR